MILSAFSECYSINTLLATNLTNISTDGEPELHCDATNGRAVSILSLVLMIGTVWLSLSIYNFKDSPFLSVRIRGMVSEYALPLGVILFSFIGTYCFAKVPGNQLLILTSLEQ